MALLYVHIYVRIFAMMRAIHVPYSLTVVFDCHVFTDTQNCAAHDVLSTTPQRVLIGTTISFYMNELLRTQRTFLEKGKNVRALRANVYCCVKFYAP